MGTCSFSDACYDSNSRNILLTVVERPGWLGRLFGFESQVHSFLGRCTVWHELPSYRRPGTFMESLLSDFETMAQHKGLIRHGP